MFCQSLYGSMVLVPDLVDMFVVQGNWESLFCNYLALAPDVVNVMFVVFQELEPSQKNLL